VRIVVVRGWQVRLMRLYLFVNALVLTAFWLQACDASGSKPNTGTGCAQYSELAAQVGCSAPKECELDPACDPQTRAWIACVRKDLAQCICESDGKLNCEGSFKPNEGPALCIDAYRALDACLEP
jgi:hypothetical protein